MAREIEPIEDMLGVYVLDAVDERERREIEAYLETDAWARDEVAAMREVTSRLAFSEERPPDALWDRIAASLGEPLQSSGAEAARVVPMVPRARWRTALVAGSAALAAAAAAVIITATVVRDDDRQAGGSELVEQAYDDALADPRGRRTQLVSDDGTLAADAVVAATGVGYLSAAGLPSLPDTETYQLWGVYGDGDVISLGVIGARPGIEPFTAKDDVTALVITREQAGGVVSSSTGAVLVGELS